MKFITVAVVASSLVAMASADMLQINNPTAGSIWNAGKSEFVGWTGNCASMGSAGQNVTVDIVQGPSNAVRFVATLGRLDCSGANTRTDFTVPQAIPSGLYALIVRTNPEASYTNSFQINNPSSGGGDGSTSPAPSASQSSAPEPTTNKPSGASSLVANGFMALAGAAAVAFQLL
ncbi:hypothetical protein BGZ65_010366 [Modicella reniformis]|uniref:Uncharacterized protein n=1 Tax=Modicella reniformis TaxID=1440133 RepID=A0A9P6MBS2_9FUNG|nr:hypothetical protein BGZ65_010366 [Modicella reniformis]